MIEADGHSAIDGLHHLRSALMQALLKTELVTLEETEKHAKATTAWKDRTGFTRAQISQHTYSLTDAYVGSFGFASRFLENGTPPHDIAAKNGGLLKFQIAGQWISKRLVKHPGTVATHFMERARDHGQQVAEYAAEHFMDQAIRAN